MKVIFSIGLLCVGVPEEMEPGTIIEYITDHDFKVVKGRFLDKSDKSTIEENKILVHQELEEKLSERFPNEKIQLDYNQHQEITPVKGMKVT